MAAARSGLATVTGAYGPGLSVTSGLLQNMKSFTIDLEKGTLSINYGDPIKTFVMDYLSITSVTVTPASGALTVS